MHFAQIKCCHVIIIITAAAVVAHSIVSLVGVLSHALPCQPSHRRNGEDDDYANE